MGVGQHFAGDIKIGVDDIVRGAHPIIEFAFGEVGEALVNARYARRVGHHAKFTLNPAFRTPLAPFASEGGWDCLWHQMKFCRIAIARFEGCIGGVLG